MAGLKTKVTNASVTDFINSVDDDTKRKDSLALLEIFGKVTGEKPKMWGTSIVGFSPRKTALTLYLMLDMEEKLMEKQYNIK